MGDKVVVLGAGFLGTNVALNLLDTDKEVVLIDENLDHEYLPGSIDLIRDRVEEKDLKIELDKFLEKEIVQLYEQRVEEIRPEENVVETKESLHDYDQLVVGLGGQPRTFGMDVSNTDNAWGIEPAKKLRGKLEGAEKAVIIGSGYTGLEIAGEIAERDVETIVLEARTRPAPRLTEPSSSKFLEILQNKNISFRGGQAVEEIEENNLLLESGESIETDVTVWCGGVQASKIVQKSFEVDGKGLEVNKGLSAKGYENIFAGGDSAEAECIKTAHNAMKQADIISENIQRENRELKQFEEGKRL